MDVGPRISLKENPTKYPSLKYTGFYVNLFAGLSDLYKGFPLYLGPNDNFDISLSQLTK